MAKGLTARKWPELTFSMKRLCLRHLWRTTGAIV